MSININSEWELNLEGYTIDIIDSIKIQNVTPANNENIEVENIYVEDIIACKPEQLTITNIINHQHSLTFFIQSLLEGSTIDTIKTRKNHDNTLSKNKIYDIINYLKWISNASLYLAKKINQPLLQYKSENKPNLVRSSYNFCQKYTNCHNFYCKNLEPTCRDHHFVHSILKHDVDSIIYFLSNVLKNNIQMNNEEKNNLQLSIKTLCFVTRHMSREINHIDNITNKNPELFHRNNINSQTKKKRF